MLSIFWLLAREIRKRRKLARRGQQVTGEVVGCSGSREGDGDLVLEVRFGFGSPQTGTWIEGKSSQVRKDLEGEPLPPPRTPVQLLYLNDKTYLIL